MQINRSHGKKGCGGLNKRIFFDKAVGAGRPNYKYIYKDY